MLELSKERDPYSCISQKFSQKHYRILKNHPTAQQPSLEKKLQYVRKSFTLESVKAYRNLLILPAFCCLPLVLSASNNERRWNFWIEKRTTPDETQSFVRPIGASYETKERIENFFFYPFGWEYRQPDRRYASAIFSLVQYDYHNGPTPYREGKVFPFVYFKKGVNKEADYAAVWPLGGTVKPFLGRDQISWFMWPLWVKTQNKGVVSRWMPWPFINWRKGDHCGFGFYPLGGHFYKKDEFDERYFLWPLGYHHNHWKQNTYKCGFLPFYTYEKSPNVKDLSIVWPFWGHRIENKPHYEEHRLLWPLWVQGRGELRTVKRWAPFYTFSEIKNDSNYQKTWYAWPFFRFLSWTEHGVNIQQEQFLYFLFWHQEQFHAQTDEFLGSKTHVWPLYSYWDDGHGHKQLQSLSPFEVFFPGNKVVRDVYTPLFTLFRYEEKDGSIQQSCLFKLFQEKRDKEGTSLHCPLCLDYKNTRQEKSFSILKGLLEYKKAGSEKTFRLFWIPLGKAKIVKDNRLL